MNVEHQYLRLLKDILDSGINKSDRTGTGTISVFGRQIRHDMSDGFPLFTTKKVFFKGIATELIWFLRGDTNIKYLVENGCNIWIGDAYKNYCKNKSPYHGPYYTKEEFAEKIKTDDSFAKKYGELGPIYGKQWRKRGRSENIPIAWEQGAPTHFKDKYEVDQIDQLIKDLKSNPDSRRLMVDAWNPRQLKDMVLPPCHYGFQCYTQELSLKDRSLYWTKLLGKDPSYADKLSHEDLDSKDVPKRKLSLMWNQRSVDTPLGLPFNIASYALLLEIISKSVNMIPDQLIGNLGDVHIYKNQVKGVREQLYRNPKPLPKMNINSGNSNWHLLEDIDDVINSLDCESTFKIENYEYDPAIKFPLSN